MPELRKGDGFYQHRGALRGIPGSACPQPEPNATELPSCARVSARAAQRRRRRRWRGGDGARRPGLEGQVLCHVLWHVLRQVLRRVLHVLVLYVSSKGGREEGRGGWRPGRRAPQNNFFCLLNGCVRRVLYMLTLHESTATVAEPAAPTKGSGVQRAPGATMKKPLMKKPWGTWGLGAVGGRPRV